MLEKDLNRKTEWIMDQLVLRRKELGMSHEKLAVKVKLSRSAVGLIESKKRNPTLLTVLKICNALDISLADIIMKYEELGDC